MVSVTLVLMLSASGSRRPTAPIAPSKNTQRGPPQLVLPDLFRGIFEPRGEEYGVFDSTPELKCSPCRLSTRPSTQHWLFFCMVVPHEFLN
jgi:hypothetical protein